MWWWPISNIANEQEIHNQEYLKIIDIVSKSIDLLKNEKMGALIVFERDTKLGEIIDTGTLLKSIPSIPLICNIFYDKSPLHDGALIIKNRLLYAGGCILPLTKRQNINRELGTRHRAAIGITESSDAISVVLSEETKKISIVSNGVLTTYNDINAFKTNLKKLILENVETDKYPKIFGAFNFKKSKNKSDCQ